MLYEDEHATDADPPIPHVLEREAVIELGEVSGECPRKLGVTVELVDEFVEPFYSPNESVYWFRRVTNTAMFSEFAIDQSS